MNQAVRDKLCQMLAKYGSPLVEDPRRCEGLLRDLCPQDKREIHVLLGALRERVPAELAAPAMRRGAAAAIGRLTKRLEENLALAEEPARWAVESWALALGVVTPKQLAAARPRKPKPPAIAPPAPPPVIHPPAVRREPSQWRRTVVVAASLAITVTAAGAGLAWNWPAVRDLVGGARTAAPAVQPQETEKPRVGTETPHETIVTPVNAGSTSPGDATTTKSLDVRPIELTPEELEIVRGALDREALKGGAKDAP
jgi:hypothetical protein